MSENDFDAETYRLEWEAAQGEREFAANERKLKRFRRICFSVVAALSVIVLIAVAIHAATAKSPEQDFLDGLKNHGILVANTDTAISTAKMICVRLDLKVTTENTEALNLAVGNRSLSNQDAINFVDQAKKVFC